MYTGILFPQVRYRCSMCASLICVSLVRYTQCAHNMYTYSTLTAARLINGEKQHCFYACWLEAKWFICTTLFVIFVGMHFHVSIYFNSKRLFQFTYKFQLTLTLQLPCLKQHVLPMANINYFSCSIDASYSLHNS